MVDCHLHIHTVQPDQDDVVCIGQIRHPDIPTNLNPSIVLKGSVKDVVDGIVEEGRG